VALAESGPVGGYRDGDGADDDDDDDDDDEPRGRT
jgi:hypothetical protein